MGTAPQTVQQPLVLSRAHIFGDDLAPPRQIYVTYIPVVLALAGVLGWLMSDESGMVLACVVATAVALYTLWGWLFLRAPTRFSTLLAMSLLLGYGGGALNTWITLPRGGLSLAEVMGLSEGVLSRGMAAVLFSSAALYFLGELFEKPIFGASFHFQITRKTRSLIYVGTLAILAGYLTHSLDVGGTVSSQGHISIPGLFLIWLYYPLTAISAAAFLTSERRSDRLLTGLSTLILLLMLTVLGRRATIYTSTEILFLLPLAGYRWRGRLIRNMLLIAGLTAFVVVCALTTMLLRISGESMRRSQKPVTVVRRFQAAGKLVKKGGAVTIASNATQQNFQSRTFVLAFLANILDASSRITPALGQDAVSLMATAVPTALYPDKDRFFSEEGLVDRQFNFSYLDEANSVLTAGATDFGLLGMILYPLLLVAIARFVYDFVGRWLTATPLMIVTLSLIFMFLQTESILTAYFVHFRDTLLFSALIVLFMSFPRFRLRA